MTDDQLRSIIRDVRVNLGSAAPDWADENSHDPGVTIVQLFGWLTESQLLMNRPQRDLAARAVTRVTERLRQLQRAPRGMFEPLARPSYHAGRLLTAEDLQLEQDYVRGRLRRHNRLFVGCGVVEGLEVTVSPGGSGPSVVTIGPGFAIDPSGEEIVLPERRQHIVTLTAGSAYVIARAVDRPETPVVLDDSLTATVHSRLVEDAAIEVASDAGSALPIARIVHDGTTWQLDPDFQLTRLKSAIASNTEAVR